MAAVPELTARSEARPEGLPAGLEASAGTRQLRAELRADGVVGAVIVAVALVGEGERWLLWLRCWLQRGLALEGRGQQRCLLLLAGGVA